MTWENAAQMGQVISTLVMGIGVMVSVWIGLRGLKESKVTRAQSVRPELYFDHGGQKIPCEESDAIGIPGIDPQYARRYLINKPNDAKRLDAKVLWGRLRNHGTGSALRVRIFIIARVIHKDGEVIEVEENALKRFPYHISLNTIPSSPSHIPPQESADFLRLPTYVSWDYDKKIRAAECVCVVRWEDIFHNKFYRAQDLRVSVCRNEQEQFVVMSFSDEIRDAQIYIDMIDRFRDEQVLPRI